MASYTSNLNLKKPAGTEDALISDINDNMDKIDTAVGTINSQKVAYALGNNTVENIQSAIVTLAGTMADGEIKKVRCNITAATGFFRITAYIGELMRISSSRLCVNFRQSMDANEAVIGNYKDGTWYWAELAANSQTGSPTMSSGVTNLFFSCMKFGNIVTLNGAVSLSNAIAGMNAGIIALPAGFRPSSARDIVVYTTYNGAQGMYHFTVKADGSIITNVGGNNVSGTVLFSCAFCI